MALLDTVANSFSKATPGITSAIQGTNGDLTEPTFLVFEPIFNFNLTTGLLADESYKNSALAYLKRNGEMARYNKLKNGIATLKIILQQSPWCFEQCTGFGESISRPMDQPEIDDGKIKFMMWETLDMRVSNFIYSILDAMNDSNTRFVEILPRNLQEFAMSILVHEVRVFSNVSGIAQKALKQSADNSPQSIVQTNHFLFSFGKCRFLRTSGDEMFTDFSNEQVNEAKINLDIEFKTLVRSHNFNTLAEYDTAPETESNDDLPSFNSGSGQTRGPEGIQSFRDRVNSKLDGLSGPAGGQLTGLIADGVVRSGVVGNQFNMSSYTAGGVAMGNLINQLGNASSLSQAAIDTASNFDINLGGKNDLTRTAQSNYEAPNVGLLNKRLTINSFIPEFEQYMERLKNPALWEVINTVTSSRSVNQRKTWNNYDRP